MAGGIRKGSSSRHLSRNEDTYVDDTPDMEEAVFDLGSTQVPNTESQPDPEPQIVVHDQQGETRITLDPSDVW